MYNLSTTFYQYQHWRHDRQPIQIIRTLRPREDGRHFADDIFKTIFIKENVWISIEISAEFVPKRPVSIGLGNGLAPNRRQAITWTNDDLDVCRHMVSLGRIVLLKPFFITSAVYIVYLRVRNRAIIVSVDALAREWLSWWRHQMETFSVLLAICAENSPVPGEFSLQRPLTRSFDVTGSRCVE